VTDFEEFKSCAGFELLDFCFSSEDVSSLSGDPSLGRSRIGSNDTFRLEGEGKRQK
jgi:hypothetical protein